MRCFTLAEVLITLTILGVVAFLVIPNITKTYDDIKTISGVKNAYSILSSVLDMAIAEHGTLDRWAWPENSGYSDKNAKYFGNTVKSYFNYTKFCSSTYQGCFRYGYLSNGQTLNASHPPQQLGYRKTLVGTIYQDGNGLDHMIPSSFILKNGMTIGFAPGEFPKGWNNTGVLMVATVDINGAKPPNRAGYDIFMFDITKDRVLFVRKSWRANSSDYCNKFSNEQKYSGTNCSTWILKHGNVDYKYKNVKNLW